MKDKINVAELLKDCPEGMELDCTMYNGISFYKITDDPVFPVRIKRTDGVVITLTKYGGYVDSPSAKCVIFPKGKNTWEGFHRHFKDGDVVCYLDSIAIFKEWGDATLFRTYVTAYLHGDSTIDVAIPLFGKSIRREARLATEEEKEKLFQAIKDNGYKWNPETKTLEKLAKPKFHEGDWVVDSQLLIHQIERVVENVTTHTFGYDIVGGGYFNDNSEDVHLWTIQDAKNGDMLYHSDSASNGIFIFKELLKHEFGKKVICYCDYDSEDGFCLGESHTCCWADAKILHPATKEQRDLLFQKMKEAGYNWNAETKTLERFPKFKVGDRIILKDNPHNIPSIKIKAVTKTQYILENGDFFYIKNSTEEKYVLEDKFDITTLKPFESRVLVRTKNFHNEWIAGFFSHKDSDGFAPFWTTADKNYQQCIPYEGNEHLLGTTNDCDEYFKTWE